MSGGELTVATVVEAHDRFRGDFCSCSGNAAVAADNAPLTGWIFCIVTRGLVRGPGPCVIALARNPALTKFQDLN